MRLGLSWPTPKKIYFTTWNNTPLIPSLNFTGTSSTPPQNGSLRKYPKNTPDVQASLGTFSPTPTPSGSLLMIPALSLIFPLPWSETRQRRNIKPPAAPWALIDNHFLDPTKMIPGHLGAAVPAQSDGTSPQTILAVPSLHL